MLYYPYQEILKTFLVNLVLHLKGNKMSIGNQIKQYRKKRNYSQEYMATKLNLSQSAYSKIENEANGVDVDKLQQIAVLLDVSLEDLFSSEQVFFNQVSHNQQVNGALHITNEAAPVSESEKALYDSLIEQLKEENKHLKELLADLRKQ